MIDERWQGTNKRCQATSGPNGTGHIFIKIILEKVGVPKRTGSTLAPFDTQLTPISLSHTQRLS